jgi:hypothetical protein
MLGKGNGGNGKGIDYSGDGWKGSSSGDGWKGNKGDGSNKGWGKGPGYNDWPDVTFFNNDKGSKGKGASISMTPALPLPPQWKGAGSSSSNMMPPTQPQLTPQQTLPTQQGPPPGVVQVLPPSLEVPYSSAVYPATRHAVDGARKVLNPELPNKLLSADKAVSLTPRAPHPAAYEECWDTECWQKCKKTSEQYECAGCTYCGPCHARRKTCKWCFIKNCEEKRSPAAQSQPTLTLSLSRTNLNLV